MAEATYNPEEEVRKALKKAGLEDEYNPAKLYANPAKNAKFGMDYNWHNNLVPDDVVNLISQHETVADGLLTAAEATLENWLTHRYTNGLETDGKETDWFIGILQELARRDGFGAFAELWVAENYINSEIIPPQKGDESRGIDLRTKYTTYQVKVGDTYKSGWEKKDAKNLLWVKTQDNKVVEVRQNPGE